jgi:osmotically-inducible protein OsmY
VTLTGHVSSAAEKQKAGDIVQGLNGVTAVQNNLAVSGAEK